ncbi:probable splicing factor 3A subunit 1 [Eutrema salsugineum]|uniref:probable splicing factor 3A subunit 1 n=1 Tax=Eutrema salsugineum TaxID=72664 RepID=UPI000CECF79B|nr:probable splicing factor 3A subunit 1 [Eutrema salsugineum]
MQPTDRRFSFYCLVVDAYSKVLRTSSAAYTETVLEEYFQWLQWEELEQEEEGAPMALLELHVFVESVDFFAQMEDDLYSDIMGNQLTRMHRDLYDLYASPSTGMMQRAPTMPGMSSRLPEEPEPKRQKFDESARVLEDQLVAPGSPRIRVSVPTPDGRQVVDITVKSLSENVASLKEIIAGVVQIPAKQIKLSVKGCLLEDKKSLVQNSVGAAEDILTLSWRMSRWT